jgi:hypothetical protein
MPPPLGEFPPLLVLYQLGSLHSKIIVGCYDGLHGLVYATILWACLCKNFTVLSMQPGCHTMWECSNLRLNLGRYMFQSFWVLFWSLSSKCGMSSSWTFSFSFTHRVCSLGVSLSVMFLSVSVAGPWKCICKWTASLLFRAIESFWYFLELYTAISWSALWKVYSNQPDFKWLMDVTGESGDSAVETKLTDLTIIAARYVKII